MNTFTKIKDLNRSLIGLSPDIFYVTITSSETGNQMRFEPSSAAEWMNTYADSIITSDKNSVMIKVNDKLMRVVVWRNVPERVDLMGI